MLCVGELFGIFMQTKAGYAYERMEQKPQDVLFAVNMQTYD